MEAARDSIAVGARPPLPSRCRKSRSATISLHNNRLGRANAPRGARFDAENFFAPDCGREEQNWYLGDARRIRMQHPQHAVESPFPEASFTRIPQGLGSHCRPPSQGGIPMSAPTRAAADGGAYIIDFMQLNCAAEITHTAGWTARDNSGPRCCCLRIGRRRPVSRRRRVQARFRSLPSPRPSPSGQASTASSGRCSGEARPWSRRA